MQLGCTSGCCRSLCVVRYVRRSPQCSDGANDAGGSTRSARQISAMGRHTCSEGLPSRDRLMGQDTQGSSIHLYLDTPCPDSVPANSIGISDLLRL